MNALVSTSATDTGQSPCFVIPDPSPETTAARLNIRENYGTRHEWALAQIVAAELRNRNLLASLQSGKVAIGTSRKVAHIWNLALQSPVFDRLWRSQFTESKALAHEGVAIQFPGCDQMLVDWIVEYLESSDEKREEMIKDFQPDLLFELLLTADFFQLDKLKEVIEYLIVQAFIFDKNSLEVISSLEIGTFRTLQKFLFLSRWFQAKNPDHPLELCCRQARKVILSTIKHTPELSIDLSVIPFLLSVPAREAPKIEFSLQEGWQLDEAALRDLDDIGRAFKSKKLQMFILGERLKLLGASLEPVSPRKLYVDGFHKDNYQPNQQAAPSPVTERYLRQRSFFHLPCPSASHEAVVRSANFSDAVIALIRQYPQLKLGIEVSKEALLECESSLPSLDNVRLLALAGTLPSDDAFRERLGKIMEKMPNLDILVVNPDSLNALTGFRSFPHRLQDKKISLWKTLAGKTIKRRVAIHNGFDAEWEKREDSYVEDLKKKMLLLPLEPLSREDRRIQELIAQIPFAKSDLQNSPREHRIRNGAKCSL
ncbi:hypothetical protein [Estrella lausannensis]|uniref:Uncharacterized protein n=1 Tax=Estrella lausannensis TaxID=483423 RepID=A0A0H5E6F0_9BACT|nr:hypothetical protein [Estrella lausannensis]CRX38855.1 hypothetical protein ELAC_1527 [Estrella lausannensis]